MVYNKVSGWFAMARGGCKVFLLASGGGGKAFFWCSQGGGQTFFLPAGRRFYKRQPRNKCNLPNGIQKIDNCDRFAKHKTQLKIFSVYNFNSHELKKFYSSFNMNIKIVFYLC